jgi:hypothetical protein
MSAIEVRLGETVHVPFTLYDPNGLLVDADVLPIASVEPANSSTALLTPTVVKVSGTTGLYTVPTPATEANGFAPGVLYRVRVDATLDGVTYTATVGVLLVREVVPIANIVQGNGRTLYPITQAGGSGTTTVVLAADEPPGTAAFVGHRLLFPATGQIGTVASYDGTTKTVTFAAAFSPALSTGGGLAYTDLGFASVDAEVGPVTLAADGLDAVMVEVGINARQALAPILAASAGPSAGAGTGTSTFRAPIPGTPVRVTATTPGDGNRTLVTLALPE